MRLITKGSIPDILKEKQREATEKQLNSTDAYNMLNHSEKQIVLQSLMREQGHLCAYCMRRIPDEREMPEDIEPVTIEHWLPRRPSDGTEAGQGLDYNNLFAVCSGNRGRKKTRKTRDLTCDAKRKSEYKQLKLNPCDVSTLSKIDYKENGIMFSSDADVEDDINVKLNLNCTSCAVQLPEARKKVLEALLEEIINRKDNIAFGKEVLIALESETDLRTEYSGILIWWLRDFLSK